MRTDLVKIYLQTQSTTATTTRTEDTREHTYTRTYGSRHTSPKFVLNNGNHKHPSSSNLLQYNSLDIRQWSLVFARLRSHCMIVAVSSQLVCQQKVLSLQIKSYKFQSTLCLTCLLKFNFFK